MRNKLVAASAASTLLATLVACGSNENTTSGDEHSPTAEMTSNGDFLGAAGELETLDVAATNCIEELAKVANQPIEKISVLRVEDHASGRTHFLMIEGAAAPWSCKTSPDGSVTELLYTQEG